MIRNTINCLVDHQNSPEWKNGWQNRRIQRGKKWLTTCDQHSLDFETTRAKLTEIFDEICAAAHAKLSKRERIVSESQQRPWAICRTS
jgi:hypothetical protein